jgi:hypothetical protein
MTVTYEFQKNLRIKYKKFKCPNFLHYIKDITVMVDWIINISNQVTLYNMIPWFNKNHSTNRSNSRSYSSTSTNQRSHKDENKPYRGNNDSKSNKSYHSNNVNKNNKSTDYHSKSNESNINPNGYPHCEGCGRYHQGGARKCRFREHPDFNTSTKILWDDSVIGKKYKKAGQFGIRPNKIYDHKNESFNNLKGYKILPREPNSEEVNNIPYSLNTIITNKILYLRTEIVPEEEGNILLDTGAKANFVSEDFYLKLVSKQLVINNVIETTNRKVCSAFNNCIFSNKLITFILRIKDPINNIAFAIASFSAIVINTSPCDVIIGRNTMADHNLYEVFKLHLLATHRTQEAGVKCVCGQELNLPRRMHTSLERCSADLASLPATNSSPPMLIHERHSTLCNENTCPQYLNSLILTKEELIDVEVDEDYVDAFIDRYDPHHTPSIREDEMDYKSTSYKDKEEVMNSNITPTNEVDMSVVHLHPNLLELPPIAGTISFKNKVYSLLNKYTDTFRMTVGKKSAKVPPLILQVNKDMWFKSRNRCGPRIQSVLKDKAIREFIAQAMSDGVIEESQATHVSQVLLTPKTDGTFRFCVDYRSLNDASTSYGWPLPRIREIIIRLGVKKPKFFAKTDLTQGFYQCPLSLDSRDFTAFVTSVGTFRWKRVPMGLKGAPSYFQAKMANTVLRGLIYNICDIYIDDIIIYGETEEEFLENLDKVFNRLHEYNVTLNPKKTFINIDGIEYVGHTISADGIKIDAKKKQDVLDVPLPISQKDLKSFLGLVSYYRDHLRNHSTMVYPLHQLLLDYKPRNKIKWTDELKKVFIQVQEAVNNAPPLQFVDYDAPVYLHTDASDIGIGADLFQIKGGNVIPIAFISKALNSTESRWSTPEQECYAIFYALVKYEYLLRDIFFTLRTDHRNLTFLNESPMQKVKRWKMAIMHYNFNIEHIPGKDNVIADALSRMVKKPANMKQVRDVNDTDTDDHIYAIDEETLRDVSYFRLEDEVYEKLAKVHNSVVGHHGVERMISSLKRANENWKSMRSDCRKYIIQCVECQKMSAIKYPIHINPFTRAAYAPMDRIAIDTIGPMPEDDNGYNNIITIIDTFSRLVELVATKDTTAITAGNAIVGWIGRYGIPSQIVSDNGTQYDNEMIKTICTIMAIDQSLIQAYSHQENGIVERSNKEVGRHLVAIIHDIKCLKQWSQMLPLVQRIMNAQIHSSIGVSPAQIMFGNAIDLDRILIPKAPSAELDITTVKDDRYRTWLTSMLSTQKDVMNVALETQIETDRSHIERFNQRHQDVTEFPTNSYVLQSYENDDKRPPHKLNTKLRGPHKVIARHIRPEGPDVYTVENLAQSKFEDFKVTDLRPFHYDPERINPQEIATKDKEVYLVEAITDHQGTRARPAQMTFLVKWIGYPEPTWQPWSDVRDNFVLHNYLRDNNLKSLVPKKFRNGNT